ncbi:MAG: cytochrome c [Bacteroidetes bacterium]|nr:cytochrome c [Bacteroidota bacterium]
MKRILYLIIIAVSLSNTLFAQDWIVPDNQKDRLATFSFDENAISSGSALYLTNCKSCHGMPGEGNFAPLVPPPPDPEAAGFQSNSDGELYYKIRNGRGLMLGFQNILNSRETWETIAYVRSFNPDYLQEVSTLTGGLNKRWTDITIALMEENEETITALVSGTENGEITTVTGAEVKLMVKRTFGYLPIGELIITDELGKASFISPKDLPGDPDGTLELSVQLYDEEQFGVVITDATLAVGMPFTAVSLTEKRAMWNSMNKAPYWIIFSYFIAVLAVWGLIFYVLLQLRTIFMLGKKHGNNLKTQM